MRKALISILTTVLLAAPTLSYALPVQCECVRYLREVLGVNIRGAAATLVPNLPTANFEVGDVLLMKYPNDYHAALIVGYEGAIALPEQGVVVPRYVIIKESNFVSCTPTTRKIALTDTHIRGVYRTLSTPSV